MVTSATPRVTTSRGAPNALLWQLDNDNQRQLGTEVSSGISLGANEAASAEDAPNGIALVGNSSKAYQCSGREADPERGSSSSECSQRHIAVPKKDGSQRPVVSTKILFTASPLQN